MFWHEEGAKGNAQITLPQQQLHGLKTAIQAFKTVKLLTYRRIKNLPQGVEVGGKWQVMQAGYFRFHP